MNKTIDVVELTVNNVSSGGDIAGIFPKVIAIELNDGDVSIGINTIDENDDRVVSIELTKIQCQILADVLLRYSKT